MICADDYNRFRDFDTVEGFCGKFTRIDISGMGGDYSYGFFFLLLRLGGQQLIDSMLKGFGGAWIKTVCNGWLSHGVTP